VSDRVRARLQHVLFFPFAPDDVEWTGEFRTWEPIDPTMFGAQVQLLVGPPNDAADAFDVFVCSPSWLCMHGRQLEGFTHPLLGGVLPGRQFWFMERWDPVSLDRAIDNVLDITAAGDWAETANRIGRYVEWEYDYRYDNAQDEARGLSPMEWPDD